MLQSPGPGNIKTSSSTLGRAWSRWFLGPGQACTLDPLSQPHNAQEVGGAGSQGPLMPVPSGSPCQTSKGRLKKLDSVLGHSWALFLSQGGMCDSPCSEWGPLARQMRKQSHHCAQEGSPRGSRLQPAPRGGALHKPPARKGHAEGRQGNGQSTAQYLQPSPYFQTQARKTEPETCTQAP